MLCTCGAAFDFLLDDERDGDWLIHGEGFDPAVHFTPHQVNEQVLQNTQAWLERLHATASERAETRDQ